MENIVPAQFGSLLQLQPADPGAGTDYAFSASVPGRFIISAINFKLSTDANVANRNVNIYVGTGTDYWCRIHTSGFNHTASASATYWFYTDAIYAGNLVTQMVTMPFPQNVMLSGTLTFVTQVQNIQAGDQLSDLIIWGLRWLEPTD